MTVNPDPSSETLADEVSPVAAEHIADQTTQDVSFGKLSFFNAANGALEIALAYQAARATDPTRSEGQTRAG
jgi:hypothetical protein